MLYILVASQKQVIFCRFYLTSGHLAFPSTYSSLTMCNKICHSMVSAYENSKINFVMSVNILDDKGKELCFLV